jgi:hypothetical protein
MQLREELELSGEGDDLDSSVHDETEEGFHSVRAAAPEVQYHSPSAPMH